MPTPALRAILEDGQTHDDPSEYALFVLLEDIAAGEIRWLIVEKVSDGSGHTYVQVLGLSDGSFQVERRRGSAASHEAAPPRALREAHQTLTRWASGL